MFNVEYFVFTKLKCIIVLKKKKKKLSVLIYILSVERLHEWLNY